MQNPDRKACSYDYNFDETKARAPIEGDQQRAAYLESTEVKFINKHPGFIPYEYDPRVFGTAVIQFMNPEDVTDEDALIDTKVAPGERASYNGHFSLFESRLADYIMRTGVYNGPVNSEGIPYNIDIHHPEAQHIQTRARDVLREMPIEIVAPFAQEPETIEGVVNHLVSRVGMDRVHPIDACVDQESGVLARETGVKVINQSEILACLNLDVLIREGVIPNIPRIKGSKGLTMYTSLLALEAKKRLKSGLVAFHDTDIENPDQYAAPDHLAIPLAYPVGDINDINAIMIGRTGPGRWNESLQGENQHYLHRSMPDKIRRVAHSFAAIVWPLTGERMIRGDILRKLPWPTDMNVETFLDFALAGINAERGVQGIRVVLDPHQKIENRESTMPREFGMLYACEQGLRSYYEMLRMTDRYAHLWDIEDVGLYNLIYGNESGRTATKNERDHQPNTFVKINRGLLLPSVEMLMQMGAVDMDRLQEIVE